MHCRLLFSHDAAQIIYTKKYLYFCCCLCRNKTKTDRDILSFQCHKNVASPEKLSTNALLQFMKMIGLRNIFMPPNLHERNVPKLGGFTYPICDKPLDFSIIIIWMKPLSLLGASHDFVFYISFFNPHFFQANRTAQAHSGAILYEPPHQKTNNLHCENKDAVTAQLIYIFVFATQIALSLLL